MAQTLFSLRIFAVADPDSLRIVEGLTGWALRWCFRVRPGRSPAKLIGLSCSKPACGFWSLQVNTAGIRLSCVRLRQSPTLLTKSSIAFLRDRHQFPFV